MHRVVMHLWRLQRIIVRLAQPADREVDLDYLACEPNWEQSKDPNPGPPSSR